MKQKITVALVLLLAVLLRGAVPFPLGFWKPASTAEAGFPYDNFESYPDGQLMNGVASVGFPGSYVVSGPGIFMIDDMESYADAVMLNGLNGGLGQSAPYVDKDGYFGIKSMDDFESYPDATALNGLTGGTNWNVYGGTTMGTYTDR